MSSLGSTEAGSTCRLIHLNSLIATNSGSTVWSGSTMADNDWMECSNM